MKVRRTLRYAVLSSFYDIGDEANNMLRQFAVSMQMLCGTNDLSDALWARVRRGLE